MGYRMNGSPAKLGSIQGTSGHKAALKASPNKVDPTAQAALEQTRTAAEIAAEEAKNLAKNVQTVKDKALTTAGNKLETKKEINVKGAGTGPQHTGFTTSKTPTPPKGQDVKTFKTQGPDRTATTEKPGSSISEGKTETEDIPMSQQERQQKRLDRVSARRRGKGKGKSTREVMLEKKVAMTPDERIRWNQAQTEQYINLGLRATSIALGGGGGHGYASGGVDFGKTLPSQEETQRRSLGTGFQTTKPTTPSGTEYTIKGQENEEQKELKDKDKYLYGG